jgi:hypothetical protein
MQCCFSPSWGQMVHAVTSDLKGNVDKEKPCVTSLYCEPQISPLFVSVCLFFLWAHFWFLERSLISDNYNMSWLVSSHEIKMWNKKHVPYCGIHFHVASAPTLYNIEWCDARWMMTGRDLEGRVRDIIDVRTIPTLPGGSKENYETLFSIAGVEAWTGTNQVQNVTAMSTRSVYGININHISKRLFCINQHKSR